MLEFAELEAAKNFVKNHRGKLKIGENDIKVTIFTSRLSAWESTKTPAKSKCFDLTEIKAVTF